MILAALLLQNYKQYAGEHLIELPASGIVAVIGANGVGKTTLFEAVEWCLYNPLSIPNADVPPRGGVGQTRVLVTLEDPRDGARYVVERTLKRGVAGGQVYREDRPDAPIVQGSRQVTDYVARHLVGLGHRAFVSTFFTRQKELSFFGNLKETERRREVGRLLGLETIRDAQRLIGDERAQARAEATSLAHQYAEQSAGRDFPSEVVAAEEAIAAKEAAAETTDAALAAATEAHARARADLERWRELERRDAALAQTLERIGGDERAAAARRAAAEAALRRLDEAAATRAPLARLAATEPEREGAIAALTTERERFERQRQLANDLTRAENSGREAADGLTRLVASAGPAARVIDGWVWTSADDANPIAGAERLATVVADLDIAGACERAEALSGCQRLVDERSEARAKLEKYCAVLDQLRAERAALVDGDDPAAAAERARGEREAALAAAQAAASTAEAAAATRRKLEPIVVALGTAAANEACPTCGRPFGEAEASFVALTLGERIAELKEQEAELARRRAQAQAWAVAAEEAESEALGRGRKVTTLDGRIAQGEPMVRDAGELYDRAVARCAEALATAGLDGEPTPAGVDEARARADLLQRLDRSLPLLRKLGDDARRAREEADAARRALTDLGPVDYDPAAHRAAEAALSEARAAAARVAQIDLELRRRPEEEGQCAQATAELARLGEERRRLEAERAALGFAPAALQQAETAEAAAYGAEKQAARSVNDAQAALREAVAARDALLKEQARIADLARRAEARGREADDLERMYREFNLFDQYVAERVTPQLAEHTGELLANITDGKYDRVAFDENYGLTIFDDDEAFPLESFSGGERDVAALSARLALSRLVGAQAARPPSFLVLDEVFGSLDADRRGQVLETLGTLTASTEAFRQLFIVSHVEDVRLSAIVDEVWRISEVDGVSRFENLTRSRGLEEL